MKPINNILSLTLLLPLFCLMGCATSSNSSATNSATPDDVQTIDKELSEIHATEGVKELVANETDEEKLREELICKSEKQLGTRFRKKVCYTKAEYEAKRRAAQEEAKELQRRRALEN